MSDHSEDDPFKGLKSQIISYLNDNGIDPKSDDEIRDGLGELYRQRDRQAIRFVRRLS
jgi:hypothetical protein